MFFHLAFSTLLLSKTCLSQTITLTGTNTASVTSDGADYPTGTEATYATLKSTITNTASSDYGTLTLLGSSIGAANSSATSTASGNATASVSVTLSRTLLVGSETSTTTSSLNGTSSQNSTATSTSTSVSPTNTQPCNGHPKFCARKYSNITYVAAHNSPFDRLGNAASNQMLPVTTQLDDGIRMLQFQTHYLNGTMQLCHTSCEILNVGTLETYLTTVTQWLQKNPYEVITILIGNQDFVDPGNFTGPVNQSGLINYVYVPPKQPMGLEDWPILSDMILTNRRAVVMLDYQANQTAIPWLLDEFSQMWETPFSPTDRAFPCTAQRPPGQGRSTSEDRMYMANHNLNIEVAVAGISLDIPAYNLLDETNGVTGYGSVGWAAQNCTTDWNRSPNFLLVDFYNLGNFNGSVFQVAANANGVLYNRASCCGTVGSGAVRLGLGGSVSAMLMAVAASFVLFS